MLICWRGVLKDAAKLMIGKRMREAASTETRKMKTEANGDKLRQGGDLSNGMRWRRGVKAMDLVAKLSEGVGGVQQRQFSSRRKAKMLAGELGLPGDVGGVGSGLRRWCL